MSIDVAMWWRALQRPVKLSEKRQWDALDVISKWLIATRGTVTQLTVVAGILGGLLAFRDGHFAWLPWLVMTLGLYFAHSAENLLNDYIDFTRGIDEENYFRAQYGVHPLVHKFWTTRDWLRWFLAAAALAVLAGAVVLFLTSFSPLVIGLIVAGVLLVPLYAYPLKYWGLGEIAIFLNWGVLIIPGVYAILAGGFTPQIGNVVIAGLAFGLGFGSFNWGKHVDKLAADKVKGVKTLPVRMGERAARYFNITTLALSYALILYLVFVARFFSPAVLLVFGAAPRAWHIIGLLSKPRPTQPPVGFDLWPRWFSTPLLRHIRLFGGLYVLGLLADIIVRSLAPGFWN